MRNDDARRADRGETSPASFGVLGALEVQVGGRPVGITAAKHRTLLCRLLLDANRAVSVDALIEALWEGRPPASAEKLVRVYVSQLRSALGAATIETRPTGYAVVVAPERLDAVRFEGLVAEGRTAAAGNADLARAAFRRALALWRGRAFADVEFSDFARAEADRLEELRLVCLEDRIAADLDAGAGGDIVSELRGLVDAHPYREGLRESLMLALYRQGRQADALEVYREARRDLRDDLGLDPGPRLRALERAILTDDPALGVPVRPGGRRSSLPAGATPILGRSDELDALRSLVERSDVRLVTLTGAGGSGKSRLALELAHAAADAFANGAALVELAPVRDPQLVPSAILDALEIEPQPSVSPFEALAQWLADRELLLMLDNLEHLVSFGTELAALISRTPHLTVVVTSRRVLHLTGEHVFPVPPLDEQAAVELFAARAEAVARGSTGGPAFESVAREICRRVDCLPLAIELAAARTKTLTPSLLLERLDDRLGLLVDGPRDLPARQRTLRETLSWSTDLLADDERRGLARLGVFAGGCSIDAAAAVCHLDLAQLDTLVADSLVLRTLAGDAPRFTLLETVREQALELLGEDRREAELGHARWFARLADEYFDFLIAPDGIDGATQARWHAIFDLELDNFRSAFDTSDANDDPETALRIARGLWRYWHVRGYIAEGLSRSRRALERAPQADRVRRADTLVGAAGLAWNLGDLTEARALADEALRVARDAGHRKGVLDAHNTLGLIAHHAGDPAGARDHLERCLAIAVELELESMVMVAKLNLADLDFADGRVEDAAALWREVLAYHREHESHEGIGHAQLNLGLASFRAGDLPAARDCFAESEAEFEKVGFREHVGHARLGLAAVLAQQGDADGAVALLGSSNTILAETMTAAAAFDPTLAAETEQKLRDLLGQNEFELALAEARQSS